MIGDGKLIGKNFEGSSRGQIEVLYWNLPRETEENHEKYHDSRYTGRDTNRELP
jgi:hypothetical protein